MTRAGTCYRYALSAFLTQNHADKPSIHRFVFFPFSHLQEEQTVVTPFLIMICLPHLGHLMVMYPWPELNRHLRD